MSYYRNSRDSQDSESPLPRVSQTNYNYTNKDSKFSRGTMRSRPEDAYQNYQEKMKKLAMIDYMNPIARLEYEEKLTEMHTRKTAKSQKVIDMKLRSKNPIAEFIDEEEEQDEMLDELIEYKYGNQGSKQKFYYDRSSVKKQFVFCPMCDKIHTDSPTRHTIECDYKELSKSPLYYFESLDRIKESLGRLMSQEASELESMIGKIRRSQNVAKELNELYQICKDDPVLSKICQKLMQIVQETQE